MCIYAGIMHFRGFKSQWGENIFVLVAGILPPAVNIVYVKHCLNGGKCVIRKAQGADIPAIQTVARVAWEHTYKEIMKPATRSHFLDEFYNYDALSKAQTIEPGGIWVAERDRRVVGFIQVVPMLDGSGLELTRLYVLPEFQRQGIGQALLEQVEAQFPSFSWWTLVEHEDHGAVAFYERNGFAKRRELMLNIFGEDLRFVEFYKESK